MAKPAYQKRTTPLQRGARSKVSPTARRARAGLVMNRGVLYNKRTGMPAGPNAAQAAQPRQQGFNPGQVVRDFFSTVSPQDNLFKQIGTKIKSPRR